MSASVWVPIVVAALAAMAAIGAALVSASSAKASRLAQSETDRLALLEQRLSERKYDVYKEPIEIMGRVISGKKVPEQELVDSLRNFATWVSVVGSDDAVTAWAHLMQSTFHNAPPPVMMRLYAEFQLAARRDMGDPDTSLTALDLMALRLTDLFSGDPTYRDAMTKPINELCADHGWKAPWAQEREAAELAVPPTEPRRTTSEASR